MTPPIAVGVHEMCFRTSLAHLAHRTMRVHAWLLGFRWTEYCKPGDAPGELEALRRLPAARRSRRCRSTFAGSTTSGRWSACVTAPGAHGSGTFQSRRLADSNRRTRLCRPLPNHSAKAPAGNIVSAGPAGDG